MRAFWLVLPVAVALSACGGSGKAGSSSSASAATSTTPPAAVAAPSAEDATLTKALACAAGGVAQQKDMLAAAVKLGKGQAAGAMVAPMWAKAVNDWGASHGQTDAQSQARVNQAIDKASAAVTAGHPPLNEAALEDCVNNAHF